jgi:hypothetical protein
MRASRVCPQNTLRAATPRIRIIGFAQFAHIDVDIRLIGLDGTSRFD